MKRTLQDGVHGQTMRWTWTEGPTKGSTHEHTFNDDGTVMWRSINGDAQPTPDKTGERADYAVFKVTDDVSAVSYLSDSGYTLSVVLNFADKDIVGFASNSEQWFPVKGKFEVVGPAKGKTH